MSVDIIVGAIGILGAMQKKKRSGWKITLKPTEVENRLFGVVAEEEDIEENFPELFDEEASDEEKEAAIAQLRLSDDLTSDIRIITYATPGPSKEAPADFCVYGPGDEMFKGPNLGELLDELASELRFDQPHFMNRGGPNLVAFSLSGRWINPSYYRHSTVGDMRTFPSNSPKFANQEQEASYFASVAWKKAASEGEPASVMASYALAQYIIHGGTSKKDIKQYQARMNMGLAHEEQLAVDGIYGPLTKAALEQLVFHGPRREGTMTSDEEDLEEKFQDMMARNF